MSDERAANSVDRKLGERLRARRLEIGMSQERLADLLGITFQQVQKYEKGINRIAASRLYGAAVALDVSVARFFEGLDGGRDDTEANPSAEDMFLKPGVAEMARFFLSIESEKVRDLMLELMRAMAERKS